MVRFLSPAWFERLRTHHASAEAPLAGDGSTVVLRQVVTGTPEGGDVRYDVVVAGERSLLRPAADAPADLTLTTDFATANAVASGRTSTEAALAEGKMKVAGNLAALADLSGGLARMDPMPADLRAETEFV